MLDALLVMHVGVCHTLCALATTAARQAIAYITVLTCVAYCIKVGRLRALQHTTGCLQNIRGTA